jgi:hypothetical protein
VFTGDLAGSRPPLRSGHPKAVQIAVLHWLKKYPTFGCEPNAWRPPDYFFVENIGFSQISHRLSARKSERTYYVLNDVKSVVRK